MRVFNKIITWLKENFQVINAAILILTGLGVISSFYFSAVAASLSNYQSEIENRPYFNIYPTKKADFLMIRNVTKDYIEIGSIFDVNNFGKLPGISSTIRDSYFNLRFSDKVEIPIEIEEQNFNSSIFYPNNSGTVSISLVKIPFDNEARRDYILNQILKNQVNVQFRVAITYFSLGDHRKNKEYVFKIEGQLKTGKEKIVQITAEEAN